MKKIAIIPARGGSKRIPKKNIIDFMGLPMIAHTINAANDSGVFDAVIVSTDDEGIAAVSKEHNAEVFLRDKYADDNSPVSSAILYSLDGYEEITGDKYDIVSQLMPNCPLRSASDIQNAMSCFIEKQSEFQISTFRYGFMNPWWALKMGENSNPEFLFPNAASKRSQDLPELACPTGAVWIARTESLRGSGTFYGDGFKTFNLDWKSAVDIDDQSDLEFAKAVYQITQQ